MTPTQAEQDEALRVYRAWVQMLKTAYVRDEWLAHEMKKNLLVLGYIKDKNPDALQVIWNESG